MEELINFGKGPLFRFSFSIMILGLLRVMFLSLLNGFEAKKRARDKMVPKGYIRKMTIGFILPIRAFRVKPFDAIVSILFHIGLLLTPIFLFDHALLFQRSIGTSCLGITLPKEIADNLTIITIFSGLILLILRLTNKSSRFISRKQDFLWLILLIIPFITGFVCSRFAVKPDTYNLLMLIHIFSGCLIFMLIPFTKIAHCVLLPLSQWISARAWKFPSEAGKNILVTLGKREEKL